MKCRLIENLTCDPDDCFPNGKMSIGTVIDHPQAFLLVENGCAEPADEECRKAAPLTPEEIKRRHDIYQRMTAGVSQEDVEAWNRGWMRGYNPDGTWKPGPNAEEFEEEVWEEYKRNSPLVLP
jgi:hypothetical protein